MSETTQTPAPAAAADPAPAPAAPAHVSMLAAWRADIEGVAKNLGVDVEKLWALVKEHM